MADEITATDHLSFDTHFGKVNVQPGDVYILDDNRLDQVKREVTAVDGTITSLIVNFTLMQVPPV